MSLFDPTSPLSIDPSDSGPSLIDKFIFNTVHSSPSVMTVSTQIEAVLTTSRTRAWRSCSKDCSSASLSSTFGAITRYSARRITSLSFWALRSEPRVPCESTSRSMTKSSAQLGINAHQVRQLIRFAATDYASIARADAWETLAVTSMTAHFNAAATAFYSWRAWKVSDDDGRADRQLSHKSRLMAIPLCLGILVSYVLVFP